MARWRSAVVIEKWSDSDLQVTRLRLKTQRPVAAFPGSYFYLYLPDSYFRYSLLRSSAVMMLWSDVEQTVTGKTTDFHILGELSRTSDYIHARFLGILVPLQQVPPVGISVTYGQELQLHRYETVILTAKGVGIVSVLPMALHLAARKAYDVSIRSRSNQGEDPTVVLAAPPAAASVFRDVTRRIDLLWRLEYNDQDKWVADQLKALQKLDPMGLMLLVWCIYPKPRTSDPPTGKQPITYNPPFEEEPNWVAVYPEKDQSLADAEAPYSFEKALSHEVLMPGKCIVVACGDRAFTDKRRASVIRNTSRDWPIEFVEAEYRPRYNEHRPAHGRGRPRHGEDQTRHTSRVVLTRLRRRDRPADRIHSWSSTAPLQMV
ncbi:hypothetical protein F5144DRAFT_487270 [Chaetomium tenue]|uniref:Uncharacterized protein n=1 Tax=Chaetomium tenue TaxID=1854479 RepID=A0ACB7PC03_9PEZI|nr:hypothetical protein F5144DRAFT_487270 [Chaetomium globosum]